MARDIKLGYPVSGIKVKSLLIFFLPILIFSSEKKTSVAIFKANEITLLKKGEVVIGRGNVVIKYQNAHLEAEEVKYWREKHLCEAKGNVRITEGDKKFFGEEMKYNLKTKKGISSQAKIKVKPLYGGGKEIEALAEKKIMVREGIITTCDREAPHYWFKGNRILIFPEDKIVARKVWMYVRGVPCLYLPFWVRSLKEEVRGFKFTPGYDKIRETFIFRNTYFFTGKRSRGEAWLEASEEDIVLGATTHYTLKKLKGDLDLTYRFLDTSQKWNLRVNHFQMLPWDIENRASVEMISDKDYYRDYSRVTSDWLKRELESEISFQKRVNFDTFGLVFTACQDLVDEVIEGKAPYFSYAGKTRKWELFKRKGRKLILTCYPTLSLTRFYKAFFKKKENGEVSQGVTMGKGKAEISCSSPRPLLGVFQFIYNFTPNLTWHDKNKEDRRDLWEYSWQSRISLRSKFWRIYSLTWPQNLKFRHTFNPSFTYYLLPSSRRLPSDVTLHPLVSSRSFLWGGRVGNNLKINLINTFETKSKRKGIMGGRIEEKLWSQISTTYFFKESAWGDINSYLLVKPIKPFKIEYTLRYSPNHGYLSSQNLRISFFHQKYLKKRKRLLYQANFNFSYSWLHPELSLARKTLSEKTTLSGNFRVEPIKGLVFNYVPIYNFHVPKPWTHTFSFRYTLPLHCWEALFEGQLFKAPFQEKPTYRLTITLKIKEIKGAMIEIEPIKER
jgi:lipopolysaccharide export system protein LptA